MAAEPNYTVTTGDFIAEWMEEEGINAAELARRLGVTPKHVSELLRGIAPLSHALALGLERVTGVPARIWNQYESGYREDLARAQEDLLLGAQFEQAKAFPLAYLRKWEFITAPARNHADTVRQLLGLLGVASLDAWATTWREGSVAYRRAAIVRDDAPALATWLALAERHHDGLSDLPAFDRDAVRDLIPALRRLTRENPVAAIDEATAMLRTAGVVLCLKPAIPGLGIHGVTRWVNGRPVVQLSLLFKSDDQLWFTLFHELGHVILHGEKDLYVQGDETDAEREADDFATRTLVPPSHRERLPRGRDSAAVRALAAELDIAPGIVLGQAQRITRDFAWGHDLKVKIDFAVRPDHGART